MAASDSGGSYVGSGRPAVCPSRGCPCQGRLLKRTEHVDDEDVGDEVAGALLGVHGLNKRTGVCRSHDALPDALANMIIAAAVAMTSVTSDVDEARTRPDNAWPR